MCEVSIKSENLKNDGDKLTQYMNYLVKVLFQHILSIHPKLEFINYFAQRYIKKALPLNEDSFFKKVKTAYRHYCNYVNYKNIESETKIFFEFGAGWDFIIPFSLYAFGIHQQILIDIYPKMRLELINDSLKKFNKNTPFIEQELGINLKTMPSSSIKNITKLKDAFGIEYFAPKNAMDTNFPSDTFDCITNTDTLAHIPPKDLKKVLDECYRIMKPGAVMSCVINLADNNAYIDEKISQYNFLKYSDLTWAFLNPPISYQNRLRYSDYIRMFKEANYKILKEEIAKPTDKDIQILNNLKISEKFSSYSVQDLAIKEFSIVLSK